MRNTKLRRADVLKIIDMPARPFDAMLSREQVPWPRRDPGRGWGQFSTEDAYRVALAHALVRQGRNYEEAGAAVRRDFDELVNVECSDLGDLLLGYFITETEPNEEDGVRLHLSVVAPQSIWFDEVARVKSVVGENDSLIAFSAVNATAVMRRTLAKAELAGLVDDRLLDLAAKVRAV